MTDFRNIVIGFVMIFAGLIGIGITLTYLTQYGFIVYVSIIASVIIVIVGIMFAVPSSKRNWGSKK